MIETLPSNTANESLDVRVLPWTLRCDHDLVDSHVLDPLSKDCPIDTIPIAEEIPGRFIPGKGFHHLLRCPHGSWMFRHMKMHDPAPLVGEDDEDEKHTERHGRDGEEIERDQVLGVALQKRLPRR